MAGQQKLLTGKIFNKKVYKFICIILGILLVIILCPIPKRLHYTFQGSKISGGKTSGNVEICIKGWYLKYLFHKDAIRGTINILPIAEKEKEDKTFRFMGEVFTFDEGVQLCGLIRYSPSLNYYVPGQIYFLDSFNSILITDNTMENGCYQASSIEDNVLLTNYYERLIMQN